MAAPDDLTYEKVMSSYQELLDERYEWDQEARDISDYVAPGRGIFTLYTRPQKRKLTSPKVSNNTAEEALYVLAAAMQGRLSSPMVPWFTLSWADDQLDEIDPLKIWLQDAETKLHAALQKSNFYNIVHNFYVEYAGFGTACTYMGEDTPPDGPDFRFELLTYGEFVFADGIDGRPSVFARPIHKSKRELVDEYPDTVREEVIKEVEENQSGIDKVDQIIIEYVIRRPFMDKNYTRVVYEITGSANQHDNDGKEPLLMDGFYEFPYPLGRWGTIGSDTYGTGPGARAVKPSKRLQQQEASFQMGMHKEADPPIYAPNRMKGKLNKLPGGENFYKNPQEVVSRLYDNRFDYQGVSIGIDRTEEQIRRIFYNDVFITQMRDPNASPLRTGQVTVQEHEKLMRLGPVVTRLQYEYYTTIIERGFNIMLRKGKMPQLSPELADMASDYNITVISPLATAQRRASLQGLQHFLGFVGQAAQFDQRVIDIVDIDKAARHVAEVDNVHYDHGLRTQDETTAVRTERQEASAQVAEEERERANAETAATVDANQATARKTESEAALNLLEGQQVVDQLGGI